MQAEYLYGTFRRVEWALDNFQYAQDACINAFIHAYIKEELHNNNKAKRKGIRKEEGSHG